MTRSPVRQQALIKIQRFFMVVGFLAVGGMVLILARAAGYGPPDVYGLAPQGLDPSAFDRQIAILSGHAGNDSGAICTDEAGQTILTEAEVNAAVTVLAAERLRRAGADVTILEEYDERLEGLQADVLLSIHADSCIDASGYKSAHHVYSPIPRTEQRLIDCIDQHYASETGLELHPNTVTHNMTEYYAFGRIDPLTPAVILELGFLGGDQELLTQHTPIVAKGVADSLLCFLAGETAADE
jgi:N-acetylmuramoyl-L-alanine amidase